MTPADDRAGALRALFESPTGDRAADEACVLGAFGLYLAGRSDLLSVGACLELSTLADRAPSISSDAVSDHLHRELGAAPGTLFDAFDADPERSRLLVQTHGARTAEGHRPVEVTLVRPGLRPTLRQGRETAPANGLSAVRAVAAEVLREGAVPVEPVIEDFRRALALRLDLAVRAESLAALALQSRGDGDLRFPAVERGLSAAGVLTVERPTGRRLSDLLADEPEGEWAGKGGGTSRAALARRLHVAWLRLALSGRSVPVEVHGDDVAVLDDGRIAFLGGPFVRLGTEIRGALWRYLETASASDPAEAIDALLRWLAPWDERATARRQSEGPRADRLRHRLRHVVLFRDGGWGGAAEDLAEHLLVQWRLAREAGYRPTPEALLFVRGLTSIALLGHRLAPTGDPLRAALEHLRLLRAADRLRRAAGPGGLVRDLERSAALFAELPGKIDRVLGLAESGRLGVHPDERPGDRPRPGPASRRSPVVVALAVFVALAAIAVVAFRLGEAGALEAGTERLAAGLIAVFGAALLWAVSRRR